MKKGNALVEQVNRDGSIVIDYDYSLSVSDIRNRLEKYFPKLKKWTGEGLSNFYVGMYNGKRYAIRCKNITYLGNPHPIFKKRIQISDDLQNYYKSAIEIGAKPILLGVYEHDSKTLFVDFRIDTYVEKKAHNSSAHIYTYDLAIAMTEGYFQKTDYFGNTITAFPAENVNVFLDDYLFENEDSAYAFNTESMYDTTEHNSIIKEEGYLQEVFDKSDKEVYQIEVQKTSEEEKIRYAQEYKKKLQERVIPYVKKFFEKERKEWNGIDCYREMIENNYKNKYQPEWPGFYLEFEFEKYINDSGVKDVVQYYQDKSSGGIDLDLYFPCLDSYGDLKSHSINSSGIPGNDWDTVMSIIDEKKINSHIYYIVCENEVEKDSDHEYEVTNYWNTMQKKKNLMSYHKKMKHNVKLNKMYVLDINNDNKEHLTIFKQGINSNGKPRKPKIMIEDKNLKEFVIAEFIL